MFKFVVYLLSAAVPYVLSHETVCLNEMLRYEQQSTFNLLGDTEQKWHYLASVIKII